MEVVMKNAMLLFLAVSLGGVAHAAEPWPGETWQESRNLTGLHGNFTNNLSGAHWNPVTHTLWVCVNGPGMFIALVAGEDGVFKIEEVAGRKGVWSPGGDLESLTQVDYHNDDIYVLVEGAGYIRQYDTEVYGAVKLVRSWQITQHVPTSGRGGSEGLAFVPDSWLKKSGFVDPAGQPYVSTKGMNGLMFVAHQRGGGIYVFDLDPLDNAGVVFVGSYLTGQTESSGLEFDRSTGRLYVWHNLGSNYVEEVSLASTVQGDGRRKFNQLREWVAPKSGNLEGFAMTPADQFEHVAFITDDDNQNGYGLMLYEAFSPNQKVFTGSVASSEDDAEQVRRQVVVLTGPLELVDNGVYQKLGVRIAGVPIPKGSKVTKAHLQFTTAEEAKADLWIRGEKSPNAASFTTAKRNITSRPKTRAKVAWNPPSWAVPGTEDAAQRAEGLALIIQEQIDQPAWVAGNALVFIITGHGRRTAGSFDTGDPPTLYVEYETLGD